jgi:glycosyltransferase involved in cell wall biosynthesis
MVATAQMLPRRRGAIGPYVYSLSELLSNSNHVDILGLGKGNKRDGKVGIQTIDWNGGLFENFSIGKYSLFNERFLRRIIKLQKEAPIDILHIHDLYLSVMATVCKLKFHIPVVCSLHNETRTTLPILMFDKILPVSNYVKNSLHTKIWNVKEKTEVLPVAVDVDEFRATMSPEEAKAKLQMRDSRIILFVGRKCISKGPHILIDALPAIIKQNPEVIAVLIGPGSDFYTYTTTFTEFLGRRVRALGIEGHVVFESFIPLDLLKVFYNAADVLVFPSTWAEPLGRVILEALSYKKAVIASDVGGISDIIRNEVNGILVRPNDPLALSRAVNYLLRHTDFARRLGEEGRKTIEEKYSFEVVSRRCFEIYNELLCRL